MRRETPTCASDLLCLILVFVSCSLVSGVQSMKICTREWVLEYSSTECYLVVLM